MAKITDALKNLEAQQNQYNTRHDVAVENLREDITFLSSEVTRLQGTQGELTPEDQGIVDGIESRLKGSVEKVEALAALHPPVIPPVEPA